MINHLSLRADCIVLVFQVSSDWPLLQSLVSALVQHLLHYTNLPVSCLCAVIDSAQVEGGASLGVVVSVAVGIDSCRFVVSYSGHTLYVINDSW